MYLLNRRSRLFKYFVTVFNVVRDERSIVRRMIFQTMVRYFESFASYKNGGTSDSNNVSRSFLKNWEKSLLPTNNRGMYTRKKHRIIVKIEFRGEYEVKCDKWEHNIIYMDRLDRLRTHLYRKTFRRPDKSLVTVIT